MGNERFTPQEDDKFIYDVTVEDVKELYDNTHLDFIKVEILQMIERMMINRSNYENTKKLIESILESVIRGKKAIEQSNKRVSEEEMKLKDII